MNTTNLHYYGYKALLCQCGQSAYVVDKYGDYVDSLRHESEFMEIVELDRFERRGGIVPRVSENFQFFSIKLAPRGALCYSTSVETNNLKGKPLCLP